MGWILAYDSYVPEQEKHREALTTLGNGYFATRGATTDSKAGDQHYPGSYVAGLYNRLTSKVGDRDIENEDLANIPNWLPLTFKVEDGEWFDIDDVTVEQYRLALDTQRGLLTRSFTFKDAAGRSTRWHEERLVSMADRHQAGIRLTLEPLDWQGRITIKTALDGSVINAGVDRYKALASRHLETLETKEIDAETIFLRSRTNQSRVELALASRLRLWQDGKPITAGRETRADAETIEQTVSTDIASGLVVEKLMTLYTSRDPAITEPGMDAVAELQGIDGFAAMQSRHERAWRHLWEACDLSIASRDDTGDQLKLRVHIFHVLQTFSHHTLDYDVGVPARGWHGEAYRGHIFWDELFILPFLSLRLPELSRASLMYRYRRLSEARAAAKAQGFAGAMFPWQSSSNGREETQVVHLNPKSGNWLPDTSQTQRHVNAAICYNIWRYWEATGDDEFIHGDGAELFLSITRFWSSIASYNETSGRYEIKNVMGPDEFHTAYPGTPPEDANGINNNGYTNVLVAWLMSRALDLVETLPADRRAALLETLEIGPDELARWHDLSHKLFVAYHDGDIISQFEGYEKLEPLDWDAYRAKYGDIHRLDRLLEAEGKDVNDYMCSKQGDLLMLFQIFSADELKLVFEELGYPFTAEMIKRNIDYYIERTSHGSTLSLITHAWILARSDRELSWKLYSRALDSDIDDIQGGTTKEGIHTGAMAGTVDLAQRNYLGIETRGGVLHFNPALPDEVDSLTVRLRYRQQRLDVTATHDTLTIESQAGIAPAIDIAYRSHFRSLTPGSRHAFKLVRPDQPAPSKIAAE